MGGFSGGITDIILAVDCDGGSAARCESCSGLAVEEEAAAQESLFSWMRRYVGCGRTGKMSMIVACFATSQAEQKPQDFCLGRFKQTVWLGVVFNCRQSSRLANQAGGFQTLAAGEDTRRQRWRHIPTKGDRNEFSLSTHTNNAAACAVLE